MRQARSATRKIGILILGLLLLAATGIILTADYWCVQIGESLVCEESVQPSDAILIDNLDHNYLLFEKAQALVNSGMANRVFVLVSADRSGKRAGKVDAGFVEVMAKVAWLREYELIPFQQKEPITLNAALQTAEFLDSQPINSILLITPDFRSKRSFSTFRSVFEPRGMILSCVPVFGTRTPTNWTKTWHGIQEVGLQFLKLWYYRLVVSSQNTEYRIQNG